MLRRDFLTALGASSLALRPGDLACAADRLAALAASRDGVAPDALAEDEDFWAAIRREFTVDRNQVYLNSGTASPAPRPVQAALAQYLTIQHMSPSLYVEQLLQPERELVRERLAEALVADPEEVAVTRNTTEALQAVIFGLPLSRGDEVVTTTQDYPSLLNAWRQRGERDGVVLRTVQVPTPPPSQDALFDALWHAVTPATKVLHVSHVTFTTGQIFPVARLCEAARARGIVTIVDGAHGFQHFPFRIADLGCDYYGTSLHKWTMAPLGTGMLWMRRDRIAATWSLFASPAAMKGNIRKFEQIGTFSPAAANAVHEALLFQEGIGLERKAARLHFLRERWQARVGALPGCRLLTPLGREHGCALGAVELEGVDGSALQRWLLERHRIQVRQRVQPGEFSAVRVAPSVFTTLGEVDRFAEAMEEAVRVGVR
jgi:selenocysteine lyase/cysteine desulfurase